MTNGSVKRYLPRIVDVELDELLPYLPAISLEGPRGVGKTSTAQQRGKTFFELDKKSTQQVVAADPERLTRGPTPIVIDEWQKIPESWDIVRRAVDTENTPGRFLLTGSASPKQSPTHSGAGRIVGLRMRPYSLAERGLQVPTVSTKAFLENDVASINGSSSFLLEEYVAEIVAGGFPAMRLANPRAKRALLDGYIDRIVEKDFLEAGHKQRSPVALRRWMQAYAAASSTTASYETIRDASTSGEADKPSKSTTAPYRNVLESLWIVDPVPAWLPTKNHIKRLTASPKHQLADPALAVRLLGANEDALLTGDELGPTIVRDGTLLGALFESLVTLCVRVYAQAAEAKVYHMRTKAGNREIDLIIERPDQKVVAMEVKLSKTVSNEDVKHLLWLKEQIGDDLLDMAVITTGDEAYRRKDGVAVVPAALLGP